MGGSAAAGLLPITRNRLHAEGAPHGHPKIVVARRIATRNHGAWTLADATELDRGRYEIVGVLGRSPYATVYEAHDRKGGDRVAVKVLSLAGSHREIVEAMFRKDVDALDSTASTTRSSW
jgi:hypothetical protein